MILGVIASASAAATVSAPGGEAKTFASGVWNENGYPAGTDEVDVVSLTTPADMGVVTGMVVPLNGTTAAGATMRAVIYNGSGALMGASGEITFTGSETEGVMSFSPPVALSPSTAYSFGVHNGPLLASPYLQEVDGTSQWSTDDYADGTNATLDSPHDLDKAFVFTVQYTTA